MKIYIAAPLFNEMELERNLSVASLLEERGFSTYLPQRDGGVFYDLRDKFISDNELKKKIFDFDYNAILDCKVMLCLLDGRVPDEGMCIELGMAFALGKYCIGFKTDSRGQDIFGNNIMLEGTLDNIVNNRQQLIAVLNDFVLLNTRDKIINI